MINIAYVMKIQKKIYISKISARVYILAENPYFSPGGNRESPYFFPLFFNKKKLIVSYTVCSWLLRTKFTMVEENFDFKCSQMLQNEGLFLTSEGK